jgi:iron complex transport system substrate-binding protein
MRQAIDATSELVRRLPRRRVFFAEWLDPPLLRRHWLPELIERAGGCDVLARRVCPHGAGAGPSG